MSNDGYLVEPHLTPYHAGKSIRKKEKKTPLLPSLKKKVHFLFSSELWVMIVGIEEKELEKIQISIYI